MLRHWLAHRLRLNGCHLDSYDLGDNMHFVMELVCAQCGVRTFYRLAWYGDESEDAVWR